MVLSRVGACACRVWPCGSLGRQGEGTALRVSVRNYFNGDQLKDELQLYPVGPGQQIRLDHLRGADKVIATYVNIYGQDPFEK
jgi:hypothetical protein